MNRRKSKTDALTSQSPPGGSGEARLKCWLGNSDSSSLRSLRLKLSQHNPSYSIFSKSLAIVCIILPVHLASTKRDSFFSR